MSEDPSYIRYAIAELVADGLIEPTGEFQPRGDGTLAPVIGTRPAGSEDIHVEREAKPLEFVADGPGDLVVVLRSQRPRRAVGQDYVPRVDVTLIARVA